MLDTDISSALRIGQVEELELRWLLVSFLALPCTTTLERGRFLSGSEPRRDQAHLQTE
jgi:predicted nucleic acid-binding protein